jgi:molybdopterin molybdotransferase
MTDNISVHKDFLTLVRVLVYRQSDVFLARPVSASDPSLITTLTNSNGIVFVNGRITRSNQLKKGDIVEVALFKNIQEII